MRDICTLISCFSFEGIATNNIIVNITIDSYGRLITDTGKNCSFFNDWRKPQRFTLPVDTKNVTIKAHNPYNVGGILASFSNNLVTDGSWECADMKGCCQTSCNCGESPVYSSCCQSSCNCENFELAWKRAVTYGRNDEVTTIWYKVNKGKLNEIESNAQWIWVENSQATDVWCRKTFGKLGKN